MTVIFLNSYVHFYDSAETTKGKLIVLY